jgi:multiple sugar transport system permease protein
LRFLDFGYSATIMIASFLILSSLILIGWLVIATARQRSSGAVAE